MTTARELTTDQMKVLRWLATPEREREPKTLEDLATEIGVRPATILKWRSRKLDALAAEESRMKLFEHLPEEICSKVVDRDFIVHAVYLPPLRK